MLCCLAGVSISGWQAKEGECEDKCEGAAGPFKIVRTCEPKDSNQCKNVTLTGTSEDCPKYCPSNAGRMEYIIYILNSRAGAGVCVCGGGGGGGGGGGVLS